MKWTFYPVHAFEQHAAAWDALNARGFNSPLLSSCFVLSCLHAFKSGRERIAILGELDCPDVMCILVQQSRLAWDTFQPSQAPMGFWLMRPDMNLDAALAGLIHALPGFPLAVGITQIDPLAIARPRNFARMLTFKYIDTMHIELDVDYDAYWQARGKNLRQNMRTVRNRLEKNGLAYRFRVLTDPGEVDFAVENFARMESSGWKGGEGTAVQFDGVQGRFYVNLLQTFCRLGAGCVYYLTFNDVVVAMDLCLHRDGTVIVLKTTYDERYGEYSPAMLLHQEILRMLMQSEDFHRFEFYGKARDWQLRLTEASRTMYHLNSYRWAWLRRKMERKIGS
ncbi:MAG: GNAT family N-acetyltransferase [Burkholderiales bacterium]|nr:GNAT family N-acetyltransferase [Burkholderiales bacterium]